MESRRFRYYDLLVHIFVVILLISNLVGQKVTAIGWFRVSGAQMLFPITYIFGDVFTEVYGYGASRRAIWIGFMASALLAVLGLFAVWLPPAPEWRNQQAFATVFDFVPRMIVASLIAFWCGEFANSYVMGKNTCAPLMRNQPKAATFWPTRLEISRITTKMWTSRS